MQQGIFTLRHNAPIARNTYEMVLSGDTSAISAPGQFVNIRLDGCYLRRPISVCDYAPGELIIIYKAVGRGTEQMSLMRPGQELDVLSGLGNGYDISKSGQTPLLLGGGAGVPPLYRLARELAAQGKRVRAVLGFGSADEVFYEDKFAALGVEVLVSTVDGSYGLCGFVTAGMTPGYSYTYACGPQAMLRAVYESSATSGQYSFEERMGCGFGACMGCTCRTKYGSKRICREGPVLEKEEIIW